MTVESLTELFGVLAWPVLVLVVVLLLRREIRGLFGRVREIEGPGAVKVSMDPEKVGQIIEEGRQQNTPASKLVERIVQSALVLDRRETRILRALLDDDGRALYSYQIDYYRPALNSLISKGYVEKSGEGFALTTEGKRMTKEYLVAVLERLDKPDAD